MIARRDNLSSVIAAEIIVVLTSAFANGQVRSEGRRFWQGFRSERKAAVISARNREG